MNFILQFSGAHTMDDNQVVLMMRDRQVKIFFKSIQLNGQYFKVAQVFPSGSQFLNMQVNFIFRRFQMLAALLRIIEFISFFLPKH